uniref:Uncharacterized protein n=1 Tax=Oryza nivara TaxID=4536 RepID=A0A679BB59_ORYNI|nr:hypothetical protein [Oryza sativa f. spontanea]
MATVLAPAVRRATRTAAPCTVTPARNKTTPAGCLNELSQVWTSSSTNRCVRGQRGKHGPRIREWRSELVRPVECMWGGGARLSGRVSAWMDELAQPMDGDREVRGSDLLGKQKWGHGGDQCRGAYRGSGEVPCMSSPRASPTLTLFNWARRSCLSTSSVCLVTSLMNSAASRIARKREFHFDRRITVGRQRKIRARR